MNKTVKNPKEILRCYRSLYEQCFVPIFVKDGYATQILLEGCRLAGVKVIEYTLRREDARDIIPTLKQILPDTFVVAGSTMDSPTIVKQRTKKYPQVMTIDELAAYGVDGFVSMLPWSVSTIKKYAQTHILIPSASTVGEALAQVDAGAQFIKILGHNLSLMKECCDAPAFDFCPILATGGMTPKTMSGAAEAGAVLFGTGFGVMLDGIRSEDLTPEIVSEKIQEYQNAAKSARNKKHPQLMGSETLSDSQWLDLLPHYHPFALRRCTHLRQSSGI